MKKRPKPISPRGMEYRLRQLMEAGNSTAQAAKRLGISPQAVLKMLGAMRSHDTPVYRRTCEDALALLNLETMSHESRIRLASQLISDVLRRWPA